MASTSGFYVLAKNLSSTKLNIMPSSHLCHVNKFEYWPFQPANISDFKSKFEYGRVIGNNMVLHWIVAMKATLAEIEEIYNGKKVSNPVRKSASPTVFPLTLFSLRKERQKAKEEAPAKTKKVRDNVNKGGQGAVVLKRHYEKQKKGPIPTKVPKTTLEPHDSTSQQKTEPLDSTSSTTSTKSQKTERRPEICTSVCQRCPLLESQLNFVMREVDNYRSQNSDLKREIVELKEDLKNEKKVSQLKEAPSIMSPSKVEILKLFNENIGKVPAVFSGSIKSQVEHPLTALQYAVRKEKKFAHIDVGEDEVYIGRGKTLQKKDLQKVEDGCSFGKRVTLLCNLMWGKNNVYKHSLSAYSPRLKESIIRVTETELDAMTAILNHLLWPNPEFEVTRKNVKNAVRYTTSVARTNHVTENTESKKGNAKERNKDKINKETDDEKKGRAKDDKKDTTPDNKEEKEDNTEDDGSETGDEDEEEDNGNDEAEEENEDEEEDNDKAEEENEDEEEDNDKAEEENEDEKDETEGEKTDDDSDNDVVRSEGGHEPYDAEYPPGTDSPDMFASEYEAEVKAAQKAFVAQAKKFVLSDILED